MSEAHEPSDRAPAGTAAPRRSAAGVFFGVLVRPRSWLNLLYLLLSFPLGLFYFVVLVTLLAVGIGLVIIWVGIFVLALTAAAWWAFASFERSLADGLLATHLQPSPRPWQAATGTWPRIKAHFMSLATWKDLAFLFLKFPLGVASFCIVVTLGALSVALIAAPLYYGHVQSTGAGGAVTHGIDFGAWTVDRLWQALLLVPLGALLLIVSMHAFNGLAAVWRAVARGLLETAGQPESQPAPTVGAVPVAPAQTQTSGWDPYSYPPPAPYPQSPMQGWPYQPAPAQQPPHEAPQPAWPYGGQPPYQGQPPYPTQPPYPGQPPSQDQAQYQGQSPHQAQPAAPYQQPPQAQPPAPYQQPPYAGQQPYPSPAPHQAPAFPTPPWGEWPALYGPPAAVPSKPEAAPAEPDAPPPAAAPAEPDTAPPDAADREPETPATEPGARTEERPPAEPASHDEPHAEEERP